LFYGLLIGFIAWVIPGAMLGWLAGQIIGRLSAWLNALQFEIALPLGQNLPVDLISLLQLGDRQAQLTGLAARESSLILAVALAVAAGGMLLTGLIALFSALIYNLFAGIMGGVQVTLEPLDAPAIAKTTLAPAAAAKQAYNLTDQKTLPSTQFAPGTPATAQSAWLVSATNSSERWRLAGEVTRIGSAAENDIVVTGLGSRHAEIRLEDGRYIIYDLGTRQTWVNANQVATAHILKNGFRLQLGSAEFIVQILTTA
jgi:hypothetical protein